MRKMWCWACVMICFLIILPAAANPIYIPPKEGEIIGGRVDVQIFIAAGENGWITGWVTDLRDIVPADPIVPIPNGTEFVVQSLDCKYGLDSCWADPLSMRLPWEDGFEYEGFKNYNFQLLSMDELVPAYDSMDFIEQHEDEIRPFDEDFDFCAILPFQVRSYPNSLAKLKTIDSTFSSFKRCPLDTGYFRKYFAADRVYIDEAGDRWITFEWDGNFGKGWVNIGPAAE